MGPQDQSTHIPIPSPQEIPDARMRTELEKQRETSRRLLNDLASALYKSASHVRNRAGGAVASAARRTGHAAQYVQERYVREMVKGMGRFIVRHPASSLATAVVAGFVVGRALRNR